ncbi:MAG: hypothetical protein AAF125_04340 [Chloroflexota bacterium]
MLRRITRDPSYTLLTLAALIGIAFVFNLLLLARNPLTMRRLDRGSLIELSEKSGDNRAILYNGWATFYNRPTIIIPPDLIMLFIMEERDVLMFADAAAVIIEETVDNGAVIGSGAQVYQGSAVPIEYEDGVIEFTETYTHVFLPASDGQTLVVFQRGNQIITAGIEP